MEESIIFIIDELECVRSKEYIAIDQDENVHDVFVTTKGYSVMNCLGRIKYIVDNKNHDYEKILGRAYPLMGVTSMVDGYKFDIMEVSHLEKYNRIYQNYLK